MLFSKTSLNIHEKFWSLDCLGTEERRDDNNYVHEEFQKQLGRGPWGFYEMYLIGKIIIFLWKTKFLTALVD